MIFFGKRNIEIFNRILAEYQQIENYWVIAMKNIYLKILTLILFFCLQINLFSADNDIFLETGPYLSLKAGVNGVDTPSGRRNGFTINSLPDFGMTVQSSLSAESDLKLSFSLGYSTYSYNIIRHIDDEAFKHSYSYLTFAPEFIFGYFSFGFNFGLPMAADFDREIDTETLNMLAEFRIGGHYPLFEDETGALHIFLKAGYMLNGIYDNYRENDPLAEIIPEQSDPITDDFNPRAASVQLGFIYLFNIR